MKSKILKKLRLKNHLTLEEVAHKLNPPVRSSTVLRWETNAIKTLKTNQLKQLAKIYKIKIDYLIKFV